MKVFEIRSTSSGFLQKKQKKGQVAGLFSAV